LISRTFKPLNIYKPFKRTLKGNYWRK